MGKKREPEGKPARKRGAKDWEDRRETHASVQLYRDDANRMAVLARATHDPATDRPMSLAAWFRTALGPTLAELYESYVRSLAQPGRRPSDPPRAATG